MDIANISPFVPNNGIIIEIMTEQADAGSKSAVALVNGSNKSITFYIKAISDVLDTELTAETLMIETASDPTFEGEWAPAIDEQFDLTSILVGAGVTGEAIKYWDIPTNIQAVRARIVEAVTGGVITVRLLVNKY